MKGNKGHYVETFVEYVESRADILQLWQRSLLIHRALTEVQRVALTAPLAILSTRFRELFPQNLTADTIHALFRILISNHQEYSVSNEPVQYDLLVVDEASMINPDTFALVKKTLNKLPRRPVIVFAGDTRQKQPLENILITAFKA